MALSGATAGFRVTEFACFGLWIVMLMDIHEVKTDDLLAEPKIIAACWEKRLVTRLPIPPEKRREAV